jgi:aspartate carbamoyltransferase catalytic subunit
MNIADRPHRPHGGFAARRLLGVDDVSNTDAAFLLDLADHYAGFLRAGMRPPQRLAGKTQVNLFFEDSTRTNLSFELAGKKLGADVLSVPVAASSVNKGESLADTAETLAAMGAHVLILRHRQAHVHAELERRIGCPIVNAGDGTHEHPTQALLDAATIRAAFGRIEGLTIAICGDIRHSRVAGSGARLLARLGAQVRFVAPPALLPGDDLCPQAGRYCDLKEGVEGADVVMALRMQFERMAPEEREAAAQGYFAAYGLTHATLSLAKPGAKVMHPGPMNRGVEIDGALADDRERSLILSQVFFGVAMRMACLDALVTGGA